MIADGTTSSSLLAQQALSIVLQHWMVPQLSWNTVVLEKRQSKLRDQIFLARIKRLESNGEMAETEKEQVKRQLEYKYEESPYFFDQEEFDLVKQSLLDIHPAELLPESPSSVTWDELSEEARANVITLDDDDEEITALYEGYLLAESSFFLRPTFWHPISMMLQHQTTAFVIELHRKLFEIYRVVSSLFSKRQNKSVKNSMIAYDLATCCHWKKQLESLDAIIFSFAMIPLLLDYDRKSNFSEEQLVWSMLGNRAENLVSGEVFVQSLDFLLLKFIGATFDKVAAVDLPALFQALLAQLDKTKSAFAEPEGTQSDPLTFQQSLVGLESLNRKMIEAKKTLFSDKDRLMSSLAEAEAVEIVTVPPLPRAPLVIDVSPLSRRIDLLNDLAAIEFSLCENNCPLPYKKVATMYELKHKILTTSRSDTDPEAQQLISEEDMSVLDESINTALESLILHRWLARQSIEETDTSVYRYRSTLIKTLDALTHFAYNYLILRMNLQHEELTNLSADVKLELVAAMKTMYSLAKECVQRLKCRILSHDEVEFVILPAHTDSIPASIVIDQLSDKPVGPLINQVEKEELAMMLQFLFYTAGDRQAIPVATFSSIVSVFSKARACIQRCFSPIFTGYPFSSSKFHGYRLAAMILNYLACALVEVSQFEKIAFPAVVGQPKDLIDIGSRWPRVHHNVFNLYKNPSDQKIEMEENASQRYIADVVQTLVPKVESLTDSPVETHDNKVDALKHQLPLIELFILLSDVRQQRQTTQTLTEWMSKVSIRTKHFETSWSAKLKELIDKLKLRLEDVDAITKNRNNELLFAEATLFLIQSMVVLSAFNQDVLTLSVTKECPVDWSPVLKECFNLLKTRLEGIAMPQLFLSFEFNRFDNFQLNEINELVKSSGQDKLKVQISLLAMSQELHHCADVAKQCYFRSAVDLFDK